MSRVRQQRVSWESGPYTVGFWQLEIRIMLTIACSLLAFLIQILQRSMQCEHVFSLSQLCVTDLSYFTVSKRKIKGGGDVWACVHRRKRAKLSPHTGLSHSADDCVGGFRIWGLASVNICADGCLQQQQRAWLQQKVSVDCVPQLVSSRLCI